MPPANDSTESTKKVTDKKKKSMSVEALCELAEFQTKKMLSRRSSKDVSIPESRAVSTSNLQVPQDSQKVRTGSAVSMNEQNSNDFLQVPIAHTKSKSDPTLQESKIQDHRVNLKYEKPPQKGLKKTPSSESMNSIASFFSEFTHSKSNKNIKKREHSHTRDDKRNKTDQMISPPKNQHHKFSVNVNVEAAAMKTHSIGSLKNCKTLTKSSEFIPDIQKVNLNLAVIGPKFTGKSAMITKILTDRFLYEYMSGKLCKNHIYNKLVKFLNYEVNINFIDLSHEFCEKPIELLHLGLKYDKIYDFTHRDRKRNIE